MNTRTNLRTWRNYAVYIITVRKIERPSGDYLHANLEAIAANHYTAKAVKWSCENWLSGFDRLFEIPHSAKNGITSPQLAVKEAIRRYENGIY